MSIIISIDHGYYAIKTAPCSFPSGLTNYGTHDPYTRQGLLEFGGCFFVCGTGRQPIQRDKTVNDNYYLLTLAAIAKEIKQRGLPPECSVRIAAGLPLTSFGRDKPKFRDYLFRTRQPVHFRFEGVEYSICSSRCGMLALQNTERRRNMSKLTVTIPDDLHQQIRDELERQGITTAQFIEQAVTTFFEKPKGVSNMATRTFVIRVTNEIMDMIQVIPKDDAIERQMAEKIQTLSEQLAAAKCAVADAAKEQEALETEVGRCIMGQSRFSEALLSRLIDEKAAERKQLQNKAAALEMEIKSQSTLTANVSTYYDRFMGWSAEFRLADIDRKRMIVSQLYSRIEVKCSYEIKLVLDANYRQFLDGKIDYGVGYLIEKTDIKSLKKKRLSA